MKLKFLFAAIITLSGLPSMASLTLTHCGGDATWWNSIEGSLYNEGMPGAQAVVVDSRRYGFTAECIRYGNVPSSPITTRILSSDEVTREIQNQLAPRDKAISDLREMSYRRVSVEEKIKLKEEIKNELQEQIKKELLEELKKQNLLK
jgi:hypothetical protein